MKRVTIAVVIIFILVILFYLYYKVAGNWEQVELSILDALISVVIVFVANVTAVVVGLDIMFPDGAKVKIE